MMKKLISIVLSLFCASGVQAQQSNVSNGSHDLSYLTAKLSRLAPSKKSGAEQLPSWVLKPQGKGTYIGVSDPNSSAEKASRQVLMRAWMLSQLDCCANVKTSIQMFGSFVGGVSKSENTELTTIDAQAAKSISLVAKRMYVSKYGEYFVEFVAVDTPSSTPNQFDFVQDKASGVSLEEFSEATEIDNKYSMKGQLKATIVYQDFIDYILYPYDSTTNNSNAKYSYASTELESKPKKGEKVSRVKTFMSSKGDYLSPSLMTNNGFWYSLLGSMLRNSANYSSAINTEMSLSQNVFDSSGSVDNSSDNITNAMSSNKFRVSLVDTKIYDGNAYIEWNVELVK